MAAVQATMSLGPLCFSLLYTKGGPRGRTGARARWCGPLQVSDMIARPGAHEHLFYAAVCHFNLGQETPLSSTEKGLRRLISIQTGSSKPKVIDEYMSERTYDVVGYAKLFNKEYTHAHHRY